MTRYQKKNKVSLIESIPHELATEILSRVAASSLADISSVKLSCKGLREVTEDEYVYRHVSLDKIPLVRTWFPLCDEQEKFLNKCRQIANLEIFYREALLDFFDKTEFEFESACRKLEKGVKLGHVGSLYLSCIIFLFGGDDQHKRRGIKWIVNMKKTEFGRSKLRLCRRKLMGELSPLWGRNPLLRKPQILCSTHQRRYLRPLILYRECPRRFQWRAGIWFDEEEEPQLEDCEACNADKEVEIISKSQGGVY